MHRGGMGRQAEKETVTGRSQVMRGAAVEQSNPRSHCSMVPAIPADGTPKVTLVDMDASLNEGGPLPRTAALVVPTT